jgi:uncharacterized coiled-coil protein SlyX
MTNNDGRTQIQEHESRLIRLETKNGFQDDQIAKLGTDVEEIKDDVKSLQINSAKIQVIIGIVTALLTTALAAPLSALAAAAAVALMK